MIAFDLASLSFGTSLLQRLQQLARPTRSAVKKCCQLGVHFIQVTTICCGGSLSSVQPEVRFRANLSYVHTQLLSFAIKAQFDSNLSRCWNALRKVSCMASRASSASPKIPASVR